MIKLHKSIQISQEVNWEMFTPSAKDSNKINQFYPAHADNEVIRAETLFTKFITQYNISFSASDEFNKLVKRMFPDLPKKRH